MRKTIEQIACFLGSFFYAGFLPVAPGTVGTAAGLVWFLILKRVAPELVPASAGEAGWAFAAFMAAFFGIGVWACSRMETALGRPDPPEAVIDEAFSVFVTFAFIPVAGRAGGWILILAGFVFNRIFDILKPVPVRNLEGLPGGWGIMADDVAAGVYANLCLRAMKAVFRF